MKMHYWLILCLCIILLISCASEADQSASSATENTAAENVEPTATSIPPTDTPESALTDDTAQTAEDTAGVESLDLEGYTTTDSGLNYKLLNECSDQTPEPGYLVTVHYTGMLMDGTKFDSSYDRESPFQFLLGQGLVIRGWDEGIGLLSAGCKAEFVIPPDLGYGERGADGIIPPNATLKFEVELVEFGPHVPTEIAEADYTTTESGLQYFDLSPGQGASPQNGNNVAVHYSGWLEDGTKFDSSLERGQPFIFVIGQGNVIKGWDEGVLSMKTGGKRQLRIPPDLGYGERGAGNSIPPNATLIFEVELLGFQ